MAGEGLGRFGRDDCLAEVCDERMAECVEVGVFAVRVFVE